MSDPDPHPQALTPEQRALIALNWVTMQRKTHAACDAAWISMLRDNNTAALALTETDADRPVAVLVMVGEEQIAVVKAALSEIFTPASLDGVQPTEPTQPKSVTPLKPKAKRKPKNNEQHDEDQAA